MPAAISGTPSSPSRTRSRLRRARLAALGAEPVAVLGGEAHQRRVEAAHVEAFVAALAVAEQDEVASALLAVLAVVADRRLDSMGLHPLGRYPAKERLAEQGRRPLRQRAVLNVLRAR